MALAATDPYLAALFEDTYLAAGHDPRRSPQRVLLERLLANATASLAGGGAGAGAPVTALAESLSQALQQLLQQQQQQQQGPRASEAWPLSGLGVDNLGSLGNSTSPSPSQGGPVDISVLGLLLATALVAVNGVVSLWLHLGLHSKLAVATVRWVRGGAPLVMLSLPLDTGWRC
jgi:hypothetical protein